MDINQLRQEEQKLLDLLTKNREKQKEINKAEFVKKWGADIGDTIEWGEGNNLQKGIITAIGFFGIEPSYYWALPYNSNGELKETESIRWGPLRVGYIPITKGLKSIKLIKKADTDKAKNDEPNQH